MPTVSTTEALTLVLAPERPQLVAGTLPDLKALGSEAALVIE